jgi:hypothetical protein
LEDIDAFDTEQVQPKSAPIKKNSTTNKKQQPKEKSVAKENSLQKDSITSVNNNEVKTVVCRIAVM